MINFIRFPANQRAICTSGERRKGVAMFRGSGIFRLRVFPPTHIKKERLGSPSQFQVHVTFISGQD